MNIVPAAVWQSLESGALAAWAHRDRLVAAGRAAARLSDPGGEANGAEGAAKLAVLYHSLDDDQSRAFLQMLVEQFGPQHEALENAALAYLHGPNADRASALHDCSESLRIRILRRLNIAPAGTELLIKMRERVLKLLPEHPELKPLEWDLRHLLSSWFNRGFLELSRLDWQSSATVLEKLIRYEKVHRMSGWDDLKTRVSGSRRCFGFFHPALPEEPLIFIEVALTRSLSSQIEPLLRADDPDHRAPTTAIFYSISSCQPGLRGIPLGNFLIKQLVADLSAEIPTLRSFATLSPIPGFRAWIKKARAADVIIDHDLDRRLDALVAGSPPGPELLQPLLRLCGHYIRGQRPDGTWGPSEDPVARFHLGNGARLERVNWGGDLSTKGIEDSFGIMANYRYIPSSTARNRQRFIARGLCTCAPGLAFRAHLSSRKRRLGVDDSGSIHPI